MSYILDALRKSQQTRQPSTGTANRGAAHNISYSVSLDGWWLALGIALLAGSLIAAFLFWRGTPARPPEPPSPAAHNPAVAETSQVDGATPLAASATATETPAKRNIPVADLAEQAKVPVPAPPRKAAATWTRKKPASTGRPVAARVVAPPEASLALAEDVPLLQQMPAEFRQALPPLAVTIHVYAHDKSQQILFLNNREYGRGSEIEGGVRVEDIVPDGVVLSFRGQRFKLSRPR